VTLVYFEVYPSIKMAFEREKQIQGWSRKKKEALINKIHKDLPRLSRNYTEFGKPE
jgi:putative endonuclease